MELIINKQEPGAISCNYDELKANLVASVEHYKTLVYTEEQIKAAKEDRAKLNKLKQQLKDRLKEVETEFLAPFETFRAQVTDLIKIIDEPVAVIDAQIKEVETKEKNEKRDKINELFAELKKQAPPWLKLDSIYNPRWENKTFSIKNVESEIADKITEINKAVETLDSLPAFGFEAVEEYKRTLDVNKAIAEGQRLADIQKRKEEEAKRAAEEEARRAAEIEVQKAAEREAQAGQISPAESQSIENTPESNQGQNEPIWSAETHELIMTVDGKGFKAEITDEAKAELNKIIKNFMQLYSLKIWRIGGDK